MLNLGGADVFIILDIYYIVWYTNKVKMGLWAVFFVKIA